jgi:hypothetical protein
VGLIIIWKSSQLIGSLSFVNEYAISVDFQSKFDQSEWVSTNVYGPCTPEGKMLFLRWLKQIQMPEDVDWLIAGNFNLIRSPENRNKPGGDVTDMLLFNEGVIGCPAWYELGWRGDRLMGGEMT